MTIQQNVSLKSLNTFGIEASAKYFATFDNTDALRKILTAPDYQNEKLLILGGGSNLLFTSDNFDGLVLQNKIKGIEVVHEDQETVTVKAGAGEIWHELVLYTIAHDWGGLENLSLIPGTVGAAPMQNIGAYGVEIKDVFFELEAYEIATGTVQKFSGEECRFGYRSSIFKQEAKGHYIILSVSFRLSKKPEFNISYGAISDTLKEMGITTLSVKAISDAVISIRRSKLPDPKEIGNAGRFFKNPEIPLHLFERIQTMYPAIPSYPTSPGKTKVPAGWLIEQCGWKGKTIGHVGVHKNQALVLVNYGQAKGSELKKLASDIQESVYRKFEIKLEAEVNFI